MLLSLVRHLPTEWNKKQLLHGKRDIPILPVTEETITSIQSNLERLKKQPSFDIALASTLQRTQQTAALYGIQPEIDGLLDELDFGPFEEKQKLPYFAKMVKTGWLIRKNRFYERILKNWKKELNFF